MAIVIGMPDDDPPVGTSTPLPSTATATVTASPSVSGSPIATLSPVPTAPVSASPDPSSVSPPVDYRVEYAFNVPGDISQGSTISVIDQARGVVVRQLVPGDGILAGQPTEARISPDGSWLALRLLQDGRGVDVVYAVRLSGGGDEVIFLGESRFDPFAQRLLWSPDGRFLVTTLVDPTTGDADVTAFEAPTQETVRLTGTGSAYAASWQGATTLWMSLAGSEPRSYPYDLSSGLPARDGELGSSGDPVMAFLPTISPDGRSVIYWEGAMERTEQGWRFVDGGRLRLDTGADDRLDFSGEPLFAEGGDPPMEHARVAWAADSDAYVVWRAQVTPLGGTIPDPTRVYFGHLSYPEPRLTNDQRIDADDLPEGATVHDVALAPDGRHMAITVSFPTPGDLAQPVAELRLVTRNFGDEADRVEILGPSEIWVGPGIYAP
jgi:hypothetical protein